ncbi:hypothetical protein ASE01_18425 [Nocardioides sp. Root190]|uniref:class F sortase n=1 Tax=Nocardioides sp. Root190 TaxID=1736488 RepID=UPI0006FC8107|nr:class F sortase [Nocardioides sp. Root190]KRB73975.1 hypothetical protein ASE01_18425 [Nocardioides sp. Root190]
MSTRPPLGLLALVLLTLLVLAPTAPADAERLGPGRPDQPAFSGYTTRAGHELGIAALADGTIGICLDTGTRLWPRRSTRATTVTDPVVGYLLSTTLGPARRDGALATALWWVVGKERGLNSQPRRMTSRLAELRRESPGLHRKVLTAARTLLADARRHAAPASGYRATPPRLTSEGRTGTVGGLGIRSAAGRWVPGIRMEITLTGATFTDGRSSRTVTTTTRASESAWHRIDGEAVTVRVRYTGVPEHRYRLHRSGARFQRVAASAGTRALTTSARTAELPTPSLTTRVNLQRALSGDVLVDAVTVRGTGGAKVAGEWRLLGPVRPDSGLRCRAVRWTGAPVAGRGTFSVTGDTTVHVGRTRVLRGGCYTYQERLTASARTMATAWTPAGLVEETSLVRPRPPAVPTHPVVDTGGQGAGRSTSGATARLRAPTARVSARLSGVDFRRSVLTAPVRRTDAGIWREGARLSALVGTTVVVGHVSDRRDRPGVFHRLRRLDVGDRLTTTDAGGSNLTWRVVRVRTVDRRRLPRSLFSQGIARRLVLITCTDRVRTSTGGFHYRKNLVVEAVPY